MPFRGPIVLFVLWLAIPGIDKVGATDVGATPASARKAFNIPSQPLGSALETYARISSREVLYDGTLAEGRLSSLVDGIYTPEMALQVLLAGTGLRADFKDADFFVISLAQTERPSRNDTLRRPSEVSRYYGVLQAALKIAFCGTQMVPDNSRIAARLWVGEAGQVLQVKTLSSTGSDATDQRVETVLQRLNLGEPPPAGFAQPITIIVLPSEPDARQDCSVNRHQMRGGP